MLERFITTVSQNKFFTKDHRLLVAVSGGIDSMVLVSLLHQSKFNISLAHVNFQLRGIESYSDEAFVVEWAKKNKIQLFLKKIELEKSVGSSVQMTARKIRYTWFWELVKEFDYDYLITAHHANDLAETILYNLSKGTGISGLRGIQSAEGQLIRPLLNFTKKEISQYAKDNNIAWREDSSNVSDKYARNKLRHHVIPVLEEINPLFLDNLYLTQERLIAAETILKETVNKISKEYTSIYFGNSVIKMGWYNNPKTDIVILYELLRPFGFHYTRVKEIAHCFQSNSGIRFLSETHECLVDRNQLMIRKQTNQTSINVIIESPNFEIELNKGILIGQTLLKSNQTLDYSSNRANLDFKKIKLPLIVRNWNYGDQFQPYGMQNKKNISDYLIDIKMPLIEKEKQLVVISNKEICWLVNHRIDDRYKISNETNEVLLLEYHPKIFKI